MTLSLVRGRWRSTSLAMLVAGGAALSMLVSDQRLAASSAYRSDVDGDGLTDLQEYVERTSPDEVDSDFDGISDLEELARRSNPLDVNSLPSSAAINVGQVASVEQGIIGLATAVYVPDGNLDSLHFELGVVFRGRPIVLDVASYGHSMRSFALPGSAVGSRLAVVEVAIPERLVQRLGQLSLFSGVRGPTIAVPPVDVTTLVNFSGVIMSVEPRGPNLVYGGGTPPNGVIYRPLAGEDDIPANWTSGQVCWQRAVPVGTHGSSIVHEIEAANCQAMDSYCSTGDCAASVGRTIELPDPGALLGG